MTLPRNVTGFLAAITPLLLLLVACADEGPPKIAADGTPASITSLATVSPPPTPALTPSPTPPPEPTATPTETPTPEPTPTFAPDPVILPTVEVPVGTPTAIPGDLLARTLDAIGLRVNVLRGLSSSGPVNRQLIDRQEASAHLLADFEEDRDDIRDIQRLYITLGILEKGADLFELLLALYGEGVLGFFDDEEEKLYVVHDAGEFGASGVRIYVHEFVHNLQQQHFDIHSTFEGMESNADGGSAFRALVEGDATLAEFAYLYEHMDERERAASQEEPSEALIQAFLSMPRVIQRSYGFPYQEGAQFVANIYRTGGWDAIDKAFEDIPQSTEQILHPEKYLLSRDEPDIPELPDLVLIMGEGWTEVRRNTMGEFFLLTYMETGFSPARASAAAAGWGGDAYSLLKGPQDEMLLVLPITWDTSDDAREFFDIFIEFTETRTGVRWEPEGNDGTASLMTLAEQVIFIEVGTAETLLVFAPDLPALETVRGAMAQVDATGAESGTGGG
jgi:hypothetical protein